MRCHQNSLVKIAQGNRIHLKTLLSEQSDEWQLFPVTWYGGKQKMLECRSFVCLWYHAGSTPLTLRIVVVKTPNGKNAAEVFCSTNKNDEPLKIMNWFILRWNIEVTFEETRAHLGIETQRQWSDKAIERSTPLLMAMYSLLTLIAIKMSETKPLAVHETTSWYNKHGQLTFVDIIVAVRRSVWARKCFSKSAVHRNWEKSAEDDSQDLIYQLSLAA